jgi:hypothetical protein
MTKQVQISTFAGSLVIVFFAVLAAIPMVLLPRYNAVYVERQTRNMASADRHIRVLGPKVRADARFRNIIFSLWTGADGSLKIDGKVASDADFEELRRIVAESKPPVTTLLEICVGPQHQTRTAEFRPEERDLK